MQSSSFAPVSLAPRPLFSRNFAIGDPVRDQGAGVLAAFRLLSPGYTEHNDVPFSDIGTTISAHGPVNILHLECHGRNQGEVLPGPAIKWGDSGTEYAVEDLAAQLNDAIKDKEHCLVVLTVCESTELARLLHDDHKFPHVVYSKGRLPVKEGAQFCERFYVQLAVGLGWREAFWETQKEMPLRPAPDNPSRAGQPYMLAFGIVEGEGMSESDFAPLLDGPLGSGTAEYPVGSSHSTVLVARYQVVPFVGRDEWLADFEGWCLSSSSSSTPPEPISSTSSSLSSLPSSTLALPSLTSLLKPNSDPKTAASIVYGPGGAGKTRAMMELAYRLRRKGVLAGFIDRGTSVEQLEQILRDQRRLVIVIDYAESWPNLGDMMRTLKRRDNAGSGHLRVILLSRHVGDWLDALKKSDASVGDLLLAARIREVHETCMTPQGVIMTPQQVSASRQEMFGLALQAFGKRLDKPIPIAASAPSLADPMYKRVLMIHMAALATLFKLEFEPTSLLDVILDHEESFMGTEFEKERAKKRGLPNADAYNEQLRQVVCAITLRGGSPSKTSTDQLIGQHLQLGPLLAETSFLLHRLYPGFKMDVAPLEPDVLGEAMVFRVLKATPNQGDYLTKVFADNSGVALQAAFLLLGRLSAEKEPARSWIETLLGQDGRGRALMAFRTVLSMATSEEEDTRNRATFTRLGNALASCLRAEGTLDLAEKIRALMPSTSVALREVSLWAASTKVEHLLNETGNAEADAEYASALIDQSIEQSELGQRENALKSAEKALKIFRRLHTENGTYLAGLARSLGNVALACHKLGQHDNAVDHGNKALELHRGLDAENPWLLNSLVAIGFNNLSLFQSVLGLHEQALVSAKKAKDLYHKLAADRPREFLPDFASSLNNLGNRQAELGERKEALLSLQEAATIRRQLSAACPDAFLCDWATSLNNLGNIQSELGQHEAALQSTQEAVHLRRQLAVARPDRFLHNLASSLDSLGLRQGDLGQREAALRSTDEAMCIYRGLAAEYPDRFSHFLALSLRNLGAVRSELGQFETAKRLTQEAADIHRRLADARPNAFLPHLAGTLSNLGCILSGTGQREEALRSNAEAVDIFRFRIASTRMSIREDFAKVLQNLASQQSHFGMYDDAIVNAHESFRLFTDLAQHLPAVFNAPCAQSLQNLVSIINRQGYAFLRKGDWKKAKWILERALSLCEEHYDLEHPSTANAHDSLAEILTAGGEHYGAIEHSLHALQTLDRPDADQTLLASALANYGEALHAAEEHGEACTAIERATAIFETQGVPVDDQYHAKARRLRGDLTLIEAARSE